MVMSTKEQGAFETALVTPASLDSIKAGLSKGDVRQVTVGTALVVSIVAPPADSQGPEPPLSRIGRRSAAMSRTRTKSCSSWSRVWAP